MDEYLAAIKYFAFNFTPQDYLPCDGRSLPINQYNALFALLGTNYGGNGSTFFNIPDLRGRVPMGMGQSTGSNYSIGETGGTETVALTLNELPQHQHGADSALQATLHATGSNANEAEADGNVLAKAGVPDGRNFDVVNAYSNEDPDQALKNTSIQMSGNVQPAGGGLPHNNMMPYLTLNPCICVQGIFPQRRD